LTARPMRPFISLSCSREHDRLKGGASVLCLVRVRPVNLLLRPTLEIEKGSPIPQKGVSVRRTGQTTTGPTPARPGDWPPTADRASGPILGRFEAGGGGPAPRSFPDVSRVAESLRLYNSFAGPQRRPRGFRGIIPAEGRGAFLRRPGVSRDGYADAPTTHGPDWPRATRNPRRADRFPVACPTRNADRQRCGLRRQHPPRFTREAACEGPSGSAAGGFLL
jgi:hypothetical protein